jgi:hypothetical protein
MCYPAPGPRCSAHASAKLTKAKLAVKGASYGFTEEAFAARAKLTDTVDKAQKEYDSTPAGMKELERRARDYSGEQSEEYKTRLALGKMNRAQQLAAIKAEDAGDVKHPIKAVRGVYGETSHVDSKVRTRIENNDPRIQLMITESGEWVNRLEADETEAVSFLTSNGAGVVNGYLHGSSKSNYKGYSDEYLQETVDHLDSAFSKWERQKPILVYRGINSDVIESTHPDIWEGNHKSNLKAYVQDTFPVGGIYESKSFMSTSIDPAKANGFAMGAIVLEIISKKAAPVVVVSAWDVTEREMILPRNQKYQIVRVLNKVKIDSHERDTTIIQLIEL